MPRTINVDVTNDDTIQFGQTVYVLELKHHERIGEKCPICDDERKVTIRGEEFPCPRCRGNLQYQTKDTFNLYDYFAEEYTINEIIIKGDTVKSYYKNKNEKYIPHATFAGFTKRGNGYDSCYRKVFVDYDFREHDPTVVFLGRNISGEYCFLDKKDAKRFIEVIHERQMKALEQFNAVHNTAHKYPFDIKGDK